MKSVFLSTVKRGAKKHQLTGCLVKLHPKKLTIIKKIDIPEPSLETSFWNPRGGNRGARGLAFFNNTLYVATATVIRKYDANLNYLGDINNPKFAGLHSIHADKHGLLALSTLHDLVVRVDFSGNLIWEWNGHRSRTLQKLFGFKARKLDFGIYNKGPAEIQKYIHEDRLHLSGSCLHNGRIFVLSGKRGCVIEILSDKRDCVLINESTLNSAHDIVFVNNRMYVNSTRNQCIHVYDGNKNVRKIVSKMHNTNKKVNQFSTAGWQRGLCKYDDNTLIVGTSPLTVFLLDIPSGTVKKKKQLDRDITHCSYDLLVV